MRFSCGYGGKAVLFKWVRGNEKCWSTCVVNECCWMPFLSLSHWFFGLSLPE